jgi:hypothetical protein
MSTGKGERGCRDIGPAIGRIGGRSDVIAKVTDEHRIEAAAVGAFAK